MCLRYGDADSSFNWLANIDVALDSGDVCTNRCESPHAITVLMAIFRYPLDVVKTRV